MTNYFAITVIVLQIAAAIQYLWQQRYSDSIIWALYAAINVVLVMKTPK